MKIGDTVVLKSGDSPRMTVEETTTPVECIWFVNGLLHRDHFPADALRVVKDTRTVYHGTT